MKPKNLAQSDNREPLRNTFSVGIRSGAVSISPTPGGADININTELADGTSVKTTWTATDDDATFLVGLSKEIGR
jgi:hypothetical protein